MKAPEPSAAPSLIETMRIEVGGGMPLLEGHLQRLRRSSLTLGHVWPGAAPIRERLRGEVAELDTDRAWRVRMLLAPNGSVSVTHGPLMALPDPLPVMIAAQPRDGGAEMWLQHKTTHRPWYQETAAWLDAHPEIFDVLYWNEDGQMCEGSRTNLYMQTADGCWLTPPLKMGALPGVQRAALLEAGQVVEASITREEFLRAGRWRISNALRGWRDAVQ